MKTATEKLMFKSCVISPWAGRYGRIAGGCAWKVGHEDGGWWPLVQWKTDDTDLRCLAEDSPAAEQLAAAVVKGKQKLGGSGGGSFVINEFGQVIVPCSSGDGRRVIVGELHGRLHLANPLANSPEDSWFQIWDTEGLSPGDPWERPYLGAQYNLNQRSQIYSYRTTDEGGKSEFPAIQDEALIRALRAVRRTGAVRFIVNPYGVVLTKRPPSGDWQQDEQWESIYIGKINYQHWFKKDQ